MAWRSRGLLTGGVVLVYAAVLALPAALPPALQDLGARIDARWAPRPIAIDGRLLEGVGLGLTAMLLLAIGGLVRRRRIAADHAQARTRLEDEARRLREVEHRLRARLWDWVERPYPITFRCDLEGRRIELADRTAPVGRDANRILCIDEFEDPAHRAVLRNFVDLARTGTAPAGPVEVLLDEGPDGARWLELRLRLEANASAEQSVYGVARDVTNHKEAQLEAGIRAAIDAAWRDHSSIDTGLAGVLENMVGSLCCDVGEIWWLDDRFGVLRRGVSWHSGGDELEAFVRRTGARTFGKGLGLAGRVWADDAVVRLDHVAAAPDPRCARLAQSGPFQSAVGFPIRTGNRIVGVVVLLSGKTRVGPFGAENLERLGAAIGRLVDHKRNERALLDDEARKNAMLESALDCVITIDDQGRIVEFNPAAEKTFGRSRADVLGQPMARLLVPEEYRAGQAEAFRRCLEPGSHRFTGRRLESEGLRADGERFPIEISITSIHVGDAPRFTAYLRDITERKELDRLKDELVSTVSHELRTPLTSMRGFVELLLTRDFPPAEQKRFLAIVDTEIKRLGKLIDDFLDLQRLESGALEYDFERLALRPLIQEATEMFEHVSKRHDYRVELPDDPLHVQGDADRLRQILRNLLSNATKYSPEGGRVTVSAAVCTERVRVGIRDEGIGMDAETQSKLFRRFYRADSTATRRIGGTGLGLALVKEIVEAHGGAVGVESEPGMGSEFFFQLALAGEAT